jgi:hypothetical protein
MEVDRCKICGANLAMVGIRHRCIPRMEPKPEDSVGGAEAARRSHKPKVEGSIPSPATAQLPETGGKFDRNSYHKEYMREYMRKRRAKQREGGK